MLWQRLTITPGSCMLGYEPLDDCRGKGEKSNLARKLGWMRVALSTPGGRTDEERKAHWRAWGDKLVERSLPCRAQEVARSFGGGKFIGKA